MRRRSGAYRDEAVARPSLHELNRQIRNVEWRAIGAPINTQLRKSAFLRLVWLEAERERLFGIPAPPRRPFRSR